MDLQARAMRAKILKFCSGCQISCIIPRGYVCPVDDRDRWRFKTSVKAAAAVRRDFLMSHHCAIRSSSRLLLLPVFTHLPSAALALTTSMTL